MYQEWTSLTSMTRFGCCTLLSGRLPVRWPCRTGWLTFRSVQSFITSSFVGSILFSAHIAAYTWICCVLLRTAIPPAHPPTLHLSGRLNGFRELPQDLQLSYNVILVLSLIVTFVAFEGVELLRELDSNNKYLDELDRTKSRPKQETSEDGLLLKERRRSLGWLALVTAIAVWATGVLNTPNPFGQP